jgi:hypothetical protein
LQIYLKGSSASLASHTPAQLAQSSSVHHTTVATAQKLTSQMHRKVECGRGLRSSIGPRERALARHFFLTSLSSRVRVFSVFSG